MYKARHAAKWGRKKADKVPEFGGGLAVLGMMSVWTGWVLLMAVIFFAK